MDFKFKKYSFVLLMTLIVFSVVSCQKGGEPVPHFDDENSSFTEGVVTPMLKGDGSDGGHCDDCDEDSDGGGGIVGGDDNEDDDGGAIGGGDRDGDIDFLGGGDGDGDLGSGSTAGGK